MNESGLVGHSFAPAESHVAKFFSFIFLWPEIQPSGRINIIPGKIFFTVLARQIAMEMETTKPRLP
jgi:hypothetical protein